MKSRIKKLSLAKETLHRVAGGIANTANCPKCTEVGSSCAVFACWGTNQTECGSCLANTCGCPPPTTGCVKY
jgi:hypothetical protein